MSTTVSQAFAALRDTIKLDPAEYQRAIAVHNAVTAYLKDAGLITGAFLQGSLARKTMIAPLRDVDKVEDLLFDLLAAGANRVDRVSFHSSALQEKRAEARVLAVTAARVKAEAMAAALGQTLGEPLRIEEDGPQSAWQAPAIGNYVMNNDSAAHVGETMATGRGLKRPAAGSGQGPRRRPQPDGTTAWPSASQASTTGQ